MHNKKISITQIKSAIGKNPAQKKTLIGLGLNKISAEVVREDTLSIRGMIKKVHHLVKVKEL